MEKRLQSLKLPRDLTLGGTKPKKTFIPNLNVSRNRDKNKEIFIKTESKRKVNNKNNLKNNKRVFDKSNRFVQSSGVFSEGIGSDAVRKVRYERASTDASSVMTVPKVKKDEWQGVMNNKTEKKVYDDIMGCESPVMEDEKSSFYPVSWNENDLKQDKVPNNVKTEAKTELNGSLSLDRLKIKMDIIPKEFQESEHISDYKPALSLWNLPASFAGKGLSDDPNVQTFFDYKLEEMLEGQIGKMRVHKSGKIDVFIGCIKYQFEPMQLDTFSEKVVAIETANQKSTSIVLGQVQNRYILNPDWECLVTEL